MPIDDIHKKRKVKNWVLFGILAGFALLFYGVTIVKY